MWKGLVLVFNYKHKTPHFLCLRIRNWKDGPNPHSQLHTKLFFQVFSNKESQVVVPLVPNWCLVFK